MICTGSIRCELLVRQMRQLPLKHLRIAADMGRPAELAPIVHRGDPPVACLALSSTVSIPLISSTTVSSGAQASKAIKAKEGQEETLPAGPAV